MFCSTAACNTLVLPLGMAVLLVKIAYGINYLFGIWRGLGVLGVCDGMLGSRHWRVLDGLRDFIFVFVELAEMKIRDS